MTYGERLRGWREFRGLSRAQLAAQVDVTRQAILGLEKDRWTPSRALESKIVEALGLPPVANEPDLPLPPAKQSRAS